MTDIKTYSDALFDFKGYVSPCVFTVHFDKTTRLHVRQGGVGKMAIHSIADAMHKAKARVQSHTADGELKAIAAELLTAYRMEVTHNIGPDDKWAIEIKALRHPEGETVRATMSGMTTDDNTWKVLAYGDADQMAEIANAYRENMWFDYLNSKRKRRKKAA
ncbi:hypothetical protein [Ensifer sp. B1-9]|uniref:hypothetical protein n=1 Tax=Ensifer sp. B1-9 TaxID=3141455 RepID=UPI003D2116D9